MVLVGILLAQHYSQFGQCIWVMAFLATWDEIVTSIAIVAKTIAAVDASVEESCVWSVLEWC